MIIFCYSLQLCLPREKNENAARISTEIAAENISSAHCPRPAVTITKSVKTQIKHCNNFILDFLQKNKTLEILQ